MSRKTIPTITRPRFNAELPLDDPPLKKYIILILSVEFSHKSEAKMATKTKADENGPFKEFVLEDWLREGFEGICNQMKSKRVKVNTSEFEAHMRSAAKEQLMAVRSLVDSFIEVVDKDDKDKA